MSELPVIDFSPFLDPSSTIDAKKSTALKIDRACRDVGFFYLSHHGIPAELMDGMLSNARSFFENTTIDERKEMALKDAGEGNGDGARGWQRVEGGAKGAHEAVDFFRPVDTSGPPYEVGLGENIWPTTPADFRSVSERYIDSVVSLGISVTRAIAMALEVPEDIFTTRIDKAFWNLRILAYEGTDTKSGETKVAGIGEHTDFGILTFLMSDNQKESLQVLSKAGKWMPADPIPGCLLCNIGDMLSKWTNGMYKSTKHRVLHSSSKMRISVPLFFDPNMDALISPVLPNDGSSREDEGILYREKFINSVTYSIVS